MTKPIPAGFTNLTPHIIVKNAAQAIEFYKKAFGAEEISRHEMGPTITHAALRIGNAMLMLNDEFPDQGVLAPPEQGGGVTLHIYVEDVDVTYRRAVDAGVEVLFPLEDTFWGDRYALVKDPYGHRWSLASHIEDLTPEQIAERAKQAFAPQE